MSGNVEFHDAFERDFDALEEELQDALLVRINLLSREGINLGRPYADTFNSSRHHNMKELRFRRSKEVWRVAFAFDPNRKAILLVAGDKAGKNSTRFYQQLIATADDRFDDHLMDMKGKHDG